MKKYLTCFLAAILLACQSTPTPDTTPPAAPTAFKATAGNGAVKLEWANNTEADLESYTIFWGSSAAQQNATQVVTKTLNQYEFTGLTNGVTYFYKLQAKDMTGNISAATALVSATPITPDTTAPTIVSSLPTFNASNVGLNTQVQLTFSEAMNPSSVSVTGNLTLGAATWNAGNTVLNFITPALSFDTNYSLKIVGQDVAGTAMTPATLQFSSLTAPPTVSSSTPSNNATAIATNSQITLRFSRRMSKNTVESAFSSTPAITCTWLWIDSDQTATCTPNAALAFLTEYNIGLAATASSAANIALAAPYSLKFTTAQDRTQPALTAFTPADTSTDVSYQTAITLTFSKPMNQASVETAFGATFNCTWTWATPQNASCQPTVPLNQFSPYQITLANTATDLLGNTLQTAYGFLFTTGNAPPRIIATSPRASFSSINLPINTKIVLTFSEPVRKVATEGAFIVKIGTTVIVGTFTWNPECNAVFAPIFSDCTIMTFTPSANYSAGSTVVWTLSTATVDLNYLPLAALVTQSFVVGSQVAP